MTKLSKRGIESWIALLILGIVAIVIAIYVITQVWGPKLGSLAESFVGLFS